MSHRINPRNETPPLGRRLRRQVRIEAKVWCVAFAIAVFFQLFSGI